MWDYAFRNIRKCWVRSGLTVFGVAMMMTLVIVTTGIVDYQLRTVNQHASATAGKIFIQSALAGDSYPAIGIDLPERSADAILSRGDIQHAISGKVLFLPLQEPLYPTEPPELLLVGLEAGYEEAFTGSIGNDIRPVEGVEFFSQSRTGNPVILGQKAVALLAAQCGCGLHPGSVLRLADQDWTVAGILESSADQVVNHAAIIPLERAQALLDKTGFVSSVILVPERVDAKAGILANLRSGYPHLVVVTDDHIQKNLVEGIKVFEDMVRAIAVVVVLGAALLIMTVMLITVRERTTEIGVLRALGASRRLVIGCILWEIFLLSAAGSVLGGAAAGVILRFAMLENLFDLGHILRYLPVSILITLAAGGLPALQISRILPVESLRHKE
jgi:putative ABC transport system permease protein